MSPSEVYGQWTSASTCDGIQKLHGYDAQNYFVYSMLGTVINLYIIYLTYENYSDSLLYVYTLDWQPNQHIILFYKIWKEIVSD